MNFGSLIIGFIIGCIYTFIVWIVVMVNAENRKEFNRIAEETEIAWKEYKEAKKAQYSFFFRIIFMSSYGREVANMRNNYVRFTDDEMENIIRRFNTFTVIGILMIVLMHL